MLFTCRSCGRELDMNQLAAVATWKHETTQIQKLIQEKEQEKTSLFFKTLNLDESDLKQRQQKLQIEKQITTLTERINKLYANVKTASKQDICSSCVQSWRERAQEEKQEQQVTQQFVCDLCQQGQEGVVYKMRIDAPFAVPPIPKTKLCKICTNCKENVKEVNEYEIFGKEKGEFN